MSCDPPSVSCLLMTFRASFHFARVIGILNSGWASYICKLGGAWVLTLKGAGVGKARLLVDGESG